MENTLRLLRTLLGLGARASTSQVLAAVRAVVAGAPMAAPRAAAAADGGGDENFVVSKGDRLSGVSEVRAMSKTVEELKHMLGAATIEDIVPRFNMILHHKAGQAARQ